MAVAMRRLIALRMLCPPRLVISRLAWPSWMVGIRSMPAPQAAVVDAHALGQHEVALFGPVGAQPFEEFRGVQGVVRHVHALPDLTVLGPGLLLAGGGVYDRYPLAVLVI